MVSTDFDLSKNIKNLTAGLSHGPDFAVHKNPAG